MTFVLVEHNMRALMRLADRVCVLNFGQKIAEGMPREIAENPEVIRAYLGTKRHAAGG
jgi:branched-chain amino acid transport system ATP-binding protein